MKQWKCPECKMALKFKYGYDEKLILKVCPKCIEKMEVEENGR